jgi:hypothetical protein
MVSRVRSFVDEREAMLHRNTITSRASLTKRNFSADRFCIAEVAGNEGVRGKSAKPARGKRTRKAQDPRC